MQEGGGICVATDEGRIEKSKKFFKNRFRGEVKGESRGRLEPNIEQKLVAPPQVECRMDCKYK